MHRNSTIFASSASARRNQWIEDRLQQLADSFSIAVGGFAILDKHLHVLCRLDPDQAQSGSGPEVLRRWMAVYPPPQPHSPTGSDVDLTHASTEWNGGAGRICRGTRLDSECARRILSLTGTV